MKLLEFLGTLWFFSVCIKRKIEKNLVISIQQNSHDKNT